MKNMLKKIKSYLKTIYAFHQKTALADGFNATVDSKLSIVSPTVQLLYYIIAKLSSKRNTSVDRTGFEPASPVGETGSLPLTYRPKYTEAPVLSQIFDQKGIIQIPQVAIVLILLIGLATGLILVRQTQIFKPRAEVSTVSVNIAVSPDPVIANQDLSFTGGMNGNGVEDVRKIEISGAKGKTSSTAADSDFETLAQQSVDCPSGCQYGLHWRPDEGDVGEWYVIIDLYDVNNIPICTGWPNNNPSIPRCTGDGDFASLTVNSAAVPSGIDLDGDGQTCGTDTDDDGDSIPDTLDTDDDDDGNPDSSDLNDCLQENQGNLDPDGDNQSCQQDLDDDNDGVRDSIDTDDDGDTVLDTPDVDDCQKEDLDGCQDTDGLPEPPSVCPTPTPTSLPSPTPVVVPSVTNITMTPTSTSITPYSPGQGITTTVITQNATHFDVYYINADQNPNPNQSTPATRIIALAGVGTSWNVPTTSGHYYLVVNAHINSAHNDFTDWRSDVDNGCAWDSKIYRQTGRTLSNNLPELEIDTTVNGGNCSNRGKIDFWVGGSPTPIGGVCPLQGQTNPYGRCSGATCQYFQGCDFTDCSNCSGVVVPTVVPTSPVLPTQPPIPTVPIGTTFDCVNNQCQPVAGGRFGEPTCGNTCSSIPPTVPPTVTPSRTPTPSPTSPVGATATTAPASCANVTSPNKVKVANDTGAGCPAVLNSAAAQSSDVSSSGVFEWNNWPLIPGIGTKTVCAQFYYITGNTTCPLGNVFSKQIDLVLSTAPSATPGPSATTGPGTPTATRVPSSTTTPVRTTLEYRVAETREGLASATPGSYTLTPQSAPFTFANSNPGTKQVCVQFKGSDGVWGDPVCREIDLVGSPTISGCNISPVSGTGNVDIEITGTNFGSAEGAIIVSSNSSVTFSSWTDTKIIARYVNPPATDIPLSITTANGLVARGACSISQLAIGAQLFCPQLKDVSFPDTEVTIVEARNGASPNTEKVTLKVLKANQVGVLEGLTTKLQEGRVYKLAIKVPKGVRRVLKNNLGGFTAVRGTTNVDFSAPGSGAKLPLGDISPVGVGDGLINSGDFSQLKKDIAAGKPTSNSYSDLNQDLWVNSFEWACMRHDFDSSDDLLPTASPLVNNLTPTSAPTPTPTPTPSPTPISVILDPSMELRASKPERHVLV